jgi:hypothetical protein
VKQFYILTLAVSLLAACSTALGPSVNGIYSGGLYDNDVGFLGGFAIDVTTSGSSVSGNACFVAVTGDSACNTLSGSMSGQRFRFTVGQISFDSTVSGDNINGTYSSTAGSGRIELAKSEDSLLAPVSNGSEAQQLKAGEILEVIKQ